MSSASDYMVGNAPQGASYAAPLLNFAPLAQLPQDYFQGTQNARTLALQNAFKAGLPRNQDGSLDINTMTNTLAKLGGVDAAMPLVNLAIQQQMGNANASTIPGQGGNPAAGPVGGGASAAPASGGMPTPPRMNSGPGSNPAASGPANITGSSGSIVPDGGQLLTGDNTTPQTTPLSVATQLYGPDKAQTVAGNIAKWLGVGVNDPLTPQQLGKIKLAAGQGTPLYGTKTAQVTDEDSSASGAPVDATSATEQAGNTAAATPASGTSGAPAPVEGAGSTAPITPRPVQTQSFLSPAAQLVPPQYRSDPSQFSQLLRDQADRMGAQAVRTGKFDPQGAQALDARAKAYTDRADLIDNALKAAAEPTTEQKNAAASGAASPQAYTVRGKELENEVAQSQKTYNGIHGAAAQYERDLKPYLDVSRSLLNDPQMYTGAGSTLNLDVNRVRAALGNQAGQKAAMLAEALQKVTASSVLSQINTQKDQMAEAGSNAGRIFSSQVEQVQKAAPQMATTLGGNRFLVEVSSRMGEQNKIVDGMARDYIAQNGHLDPKFDGVVSKYLQTHPLFTKQELSHPELLGAPSLPPDKTDPRDINQWGTSLGLVAGRDAIRLPDGRYKALPRIDAVMPRTPGTLAQ